MGHRGLLLGRVGDRVVDDLVLHAVLVEQLPETVGDHEGLLDKGESPRLG
jgi:hypothetical protein